MATHQELSLEPTTAEPAETTAEAEQLWVELQIDRVANDACPVSKFRAETVNGHVQLVGEQCHASLTVDADPGGKRTVVSCSITDDCTCPRVCDPGISPTSIRIENGSLQITATAESRERLYELADSLRESDDEWQLQRLTTGAEQARANSEEERLPEEISLTDKQREVVEEAVASGYYANPREATLADLAEELDVTRSALSQRLNAVEAKLIKTLATEL